jgi:hypothetical protein
MRKIKLPGNCGLLADLIYEELTAGNGRCEYALAGLREELEECVAFLHGLPDDATPADIDIVSNFCWGDEAKKEIKRLSRRTANV